MSLPELGHWKEELIVTTSLRQQGSWATAVEVGRRPRSGVVEVIEVGRGP
jgi:hypothetical protein